MFNFVYTLRIDFFLRYISKTQSVECDNSTDY